jgi:acyl carrier protein
MTDRIRETVEGLVVRMAKQRPAASELNDQMLLRDDLRFDSLSLATLLFRLQDCFGFKLSEMRALMPTATTVGALIVAVRQLSDNAQGAGDAGR